MSMSPTHQFTVLVQTAHAVGKALEAWDQAGRPDSAAYLARGCLRDFSMTRRTVRSSAASAASGGLSCGRGAARAGRSKAPVSRPAALKIKKSAARAARLKKSVRVAILPRSCRPALCRGSVQAGCVLVGCRVT